MYIHIKQEEPILNGDSSVNVWCCLLCNRLIEPYAFDNNLKGGMYEFFLRNELPDLLEDILLLVRSQMHFQHDGAPPLYTWHVKQYLHKSFPIGWLSCGEPTRLYLSITIFRAT